MTDEQQQPFEASELEVETQEGVGSEQQQAELSDENIAVRIAELEEQLAQAQDQVLRATADMQNVRRRAEQDKEKERKFALEKFALELLPIVDSLERGVALSNPDQESTAALKEGMELTLKMFKDTFKRFQIEEVDPEGEPFNPETQQAMAMEPNDHVEPNTVIKVFQKGYLLNGRLLRPAMVVVSKA